MTTDLRGVFRELTGAEPEGLWRAPGRVNLIGEHTDYNDGLALPLAIERSATVAVRRTDDGRARCWSQQQDGVVEVEVVDLEPGSVDGWAAYVLGAAWALRQTGCPVGGFDLVLDSDVPSASGLSSSAAIECATVLALAELFGGPTDRLELARLAQRAENEMVGAPTGLMDQLSALRGRRGQALLMDFASLAVTPLPLGLAEAGLVLLVVDTRVSHDNAGADGYAARRRECAAAAEQLGGGSLRDASPGLVADRLTGTLQRRARHVVTENARVEQAAQLLRAGRLADVGPLLTASHASMRDDFEISTPELDLVVESALAAGALGARLTGAGFGGCVIALCADPERVQAAVTAAFADQRRAEPMFFVAREAGPGAQRMDGADGRADRPVAADRVLRREPTRKPDGRALTYYSWLRPR